MEEASRDARAHHNPTSVGGGERVREGGREGEVPLPGCKVHTVSVHTVI